MTKAEKLKRIIARGERSNHCHVITGDVEFNDRNEIVVGENSNAALKHLIEAKWMDGEEVWTGEHKDIQLLPGVYRYVQQTVYDPLTRRIEAVIE